MLGGNPNIEITIELRKNKVYKLLRAHQIAVKNERPENRVGSEKSGVSPKKDKVKTRMGAFYLELYRLYTDLESLLLASPRLHV